MSSHVDISSLAKNWRLDGLQYPSPTDVVNEVFASDVLTMEEMRQRLSKPVWKSLVATIERGATLDSAIADTVAMAMKTWAMERGATHFTHWFQPLTGLTAEKHESFVTPTSDGSAISQFSGKELIQGEPDASSFPSGGLRATFEARGYTAWDPTSPAFITRHSNGATLCVPTAFASWTGEALDNKTPLLRSIEDVNTAAKRALALFGDTDTQRVVSTVGVEQEYFLIDEEFYYRRPDLVMCGRTLFGAQPPKGQELEDHYFGSIPDRILTYMTDAEHQLYALGIPVKTRHNEVAPGQFEVAPIFEQSNIAADHQQLVMQVLRNTARRYGLVCLMHEKPFAGVNGSGKHVNWSMSTDGGQNLLEPGDTPQNNLQFLFFCAAIIRALDLHQDLVRTTVASASNDHRLGANEAPPAIISAYIGHFLTKALSEIESRVSDKFDEQDEVMLKLDIHKSIPELLLDNTDRNRTSPFAFTGNKFEFRAVGSSANCASCMTILNTIMAETLSNFKKEVDGHIEKGDKKDVAIMQVIKQYIKDSKKVLFEGDGYSDEWQQEAARRELPNLKTTPVALDPMVTDKAKHLFEKHKVYSHSELEARHEIELEKYIKTVQIEGRVIGDLSGNHILPASIRYQNVLITNIKGLKELGLPESAYKAQQNVLVEISEHIQQVQALAANMTEARKQANSLTHSRDKAVAYCDKVKPLFDEIRYHVDKLELLVDDSQWELPKYREILFLR